MLMQPSDNKPDYSFLSGAPTKQGPSKKRRIMIVAGGGAVLLFVVIMLFSLIFGGSGGDSPERTLRLAQMHTELVRVSEVGTDKARGQDAKNLANGTRLTLLSDQADIIAIAERNQDISSKLLAAGQDTETDETLTQAEQRSRFDEVFIPLLIEEIQEYQGELQAAHEASSSSSNKEVYSNLYDDLRKIVETTE
ncbi:MAG: hypothetical protein U5L95_02310 [Candidatus Saccharibacteria bacterium]|nr:hypothetical protein [Candidatus Saccharibacteria bacterium]